MSTQKWPSADDLLIKEAEHNRFRRIAFVTVAISTTALFASIITMPMIYSYVQELQSQITNEIGYCRVGFILNLKLWGILKMVEEWISKCKL